MGSLVHLLLPVTLLQFVLCFGLQNGLGVVRFNGRDCQAGLSSVDLWRDVGDVGATGQKVSEPASHCLSVCEGDNTSVQWMPREGN